MSKFERIHYKIIADFLKKIHGDISKDDLVEGLSIYFKDENPSFSKEIFKKACYIKELSQ
jgi:hypothetical protein